MRKTLSGQNGLAETMMKVKVKLAKDYAPATEGMKKSLSESMSRARQVVHQNQRTTA